MIEALKNSATPVLLAVLFALVGGCRTVTDVAEGPAPGVQVRDERAPQAHIRMNTVAIVDKSLQKWDTKRTVYRPSWLAIFAGGNTENQKYSKIAVEGTESKRTPTGTVEVWALLRNRTDHPLTVEGRTQFFDQQGAPTDGPSAWQRIHLPPQSVASYTERSTKVMDISYYYIEIREGR